jgi:GNAT superfamily N-acetyltransferase
MTLATVASALSVDSASCLLVQNGQEQLMLRDFNLATDQSDLDDICSMPLGESNDYVPAMVPKYMSDPNCRFLVLAHTKRQSKVESNGSSSNGIAEACLNCRNLGGGVGFIEAVRVRPSCRGRGLGKSFLSKFVHDEYERKEYKKLLTCTVETNYAMRNIFDKVGFQKITTLTGIDFKPLRKIPGWSADDKSTKCTESLLNGLNCASVISDEAKNDAPRWKALKSIGEVRGFMSRDNDSKLLCEWGCIPGLFEGIGIESQRFLDSLSDGLVFALEGKHDHPGALIAFVRDPRIASMKSNWMMSVVGTTSSHLEAALWVACSERIQRILRGHLGNSEEFIGFGVTFDTSLQIEEPLKSALSLFEEECLVYGRDLS